MGGALVEGYAGIVVNGMGMNHGEGGLCEGGS
jgi:hypothetical protein